MKTVLNPMSHSGKIIKSILNGNSRIISGDKGIGKSYTYLLYSYLASFIIEVRLKRSMFNLSRGIYSKILN